MLTDCMRNAWHARTFCLHVHETTETSVMKLSLSLSLLLSDRWTVCAHPLHRSEREREKEAGREREREREKEGGRERGGWERERVRKREREKEGDREKKRERESFQRHISKTWLPLKFCKIGLCYKTFYVSNLRIFAPLLFPGNIFHISITV